MASCLVTTGGTNGTFRLEYDLGATHVTSYYNYGDPIYIDNSATNITYTTLTGDVTATSGCVTITALAQTCYLLRYDRPMSENADYIPEIDAIVLDTTVHSFASPGSDQVSGLPTLIYNINTGLSDDNIKVMSYYSSVLPDNYIQVSLVVKIIGSEIPSLRIKSPNNNYSYIIGTVSADCVPSGYYDLGICLTPAP